MTRFGYTLLLYALLPRALLHLLWRARQQPAYLEHIPERFGYYRQTAKQPLIWVHAVSVGETPCGGAADTRPATRISAAPHPAHAHDANRQGNRGNPVW